MCVSFCPIKPLSCDCKAVAKIWAVYTVEFKQSSISAKWTSCLKRQYSRDTVLDFLDVSVLQNTLFKWSTHQQVLLEPLSNISIVPWRARVFSNSQTEVYNRNLKRKSSWSCSITTANKKWSQNVPSGHNRGLSSPFWEALKHPYIQAERAQNLRVLKILFTWCLFFF